jgi:hypothetical protein
MEEIPDKMISLRLLFGIVLGKVGTIEMFSAATDVVVDGGASKSGEFLRDLLIACGSFSSDVSRVDVIGEDDATIGVS